LLAHGYLVRVLDVLAPQVHGTDRKRPSYLHEDVELIHGDIRDAAVLEHALKGVSAVYHFVALVGVGQSMYQIEQYTSVNNLGTAMLLERVAKKRIKKLIVASSMSIYGEGRYESPSGDVCTTAGRTVEQLRCHEWEMQAPDGRMLRPLPTPEWKTPALASIYALSKFDQEQMCLITGRAYGVPTVALRFFNVYGPNQALSNPYTGVLAIFASLVHDVTGESEDLLQAAERITQFDLILTVDTMTAHLAGALGKTVWLMLNFAADWRWMTERSDSPWYPTMRIFRQQQPGRWDCVVDQVRQALQAWEQTPGSPRANFTAALRM
jgi:dTDP-L-rhamnose 4-epimerase